MSKDTYSCFAELEQAESGNFRIIKSRKHSAYAIIAPHGGKIEPGTAEIAESIAGTDLSLYIFKATSKSKPDITLHITSTNFDEPECLDLLKYTETALAIHGAKDPETDPKERVWVGGNLHNEFKPHLERELSPLNLFVGINSDFTGTSPKNICNRGTSYQGMQLELSRALRDRLKTDATFLSKFSNAVRTAMKKTYPID